ncbi:MAG: hypothetical protein IJ028_03450 [Alistipes sp.]|nr:hypothetical protein [Alistipes sp.]
MSRLLAIITLLLAGCYNSSFDEATATPQTPAVNTTIADLYGLIKESPTPIRTNVVIAGRVTTSDQSGNFYRSLMIEEEGAAVELMAGIDALHNDYPIGSRLVVSLNGLTLGKRFGVLQIGREAAPGSNYPTDYLGSKAAIDKHVVRTNEPLIKPEPLLVTTEELSPQLCGRLVRIEPLHYAPEELTEATWSGYQPFADEAGNTLYTYVRNYADFAQNEPPQGKVSLVGILQYDASGEGRYLIKMRDEADCRQL